jgi:hypothetical protein
VVDEIGAHEIFPSVRAALVPKNRRAQPITPLRRDRGATDHPAFVGEPISFARSPGPSHHDAAGSVRYRGTRLLLLLWAIGNRDPVRQRGCRRKTAPSAWPKDLFGKGAIMKCDICGQDVENSEDLQKHMEQAHPTGAGDNLETPDLVGDTPDESAASEVPKATY